MTRRNGHINGKVATIAPPHNHEAEDAVIGALLIDIDAVLRVSDFLSAADFQTKRNGIIFEAILSLYRKRTPADLVTITEELERRGALDDVGGPAYLTDLMNATPTSMHVEYYGRIVRNLALHRRLIDAGTKVTQLGYDVQPDDDIDEVINQAEQAIYAVNPERAGRNVVPIGKAIDDYYDLIEYRSQHRGEIIGIPTGLRDLDRLVGGFQRAKLYIVAGRPGMGKTALGLNAARHAARKFGRRVMIFSLEMAVEELTGRMVSAETGIDSQRLERGEIKDDEWPLITRATGLLRDAPVHFDDTPGISVMELRSKARRIEAEHGLDLIVVDYLQLMSGDKRSENRQQEISYISRSLKELARELNIPVLALSQLSRKVEDRHDKRPMLSDLRESGSLEQDADVVAFVYRDEIYNPDTDIPNVAEIIISKHRAGPTGMFSVFFKKRLAQFVDLDVRTNPEAYR